MKKTRKIKYYYHYCVNDDYLISIRLKEFLKNVLIKKYSWTNLRMQALQLKQLLTFPLRYTWQILTLKIFKVTSGVQLYHQNQRYNSKDLIFREYQDESRQIQSFFSSKIFISFIAEWIPQITEDSFFWLFVKLPTST